MVRPDGTIGSYYVVTGRDSVAVIALDADLNVFLVELFRYTTGKLSVEVPMGALDGDPPLSAAKRELREETGIVASEWKQLGLLHPDNGIRNGTTHIFMATQLVQTDDNEQAVEGITRQIKVPLMDAVRMIRSGEITDAESIGPLVMAALELGLVN